MLNLLLVLVLAAIGSLVAAAVIMFGWVPLSTAMDIADARRRHLDDVAVRDAVERSKRHDR